MRIVIEIDGTEATTSVLRTGAAPQSGAAAPGASTYTALPTGVTAEEGIGAHDAGPAPAMATISPGAPPIPSPSPSSGAQSAGVGDLAAGAAPNA